MLKLRRRIGVSARERELILTREPDRCRILVGEPARLSELRSRMRSQSSSESEGELSAFVDRQASLTLDRRERSVTGSRYKVPQDVKDQMIGSRRFEAGIVALAEQLRQPPAEVRAEALGYLEEMACTQSTLARELWALMARGMYSRAYELCFDPMAIERCESSASSIRWCSCRPTDPTSTATCWRRSSTSKGSRRTTRSVGSTWRSGRSARSAVASG